MITIKIIEIREKSRARKRLRHCRSHRHPPHRLQKQFNEQHIERIAAAIAVAAWVELVLVGVEI